MRKSFDHPVHELLLALLKQAREKARLTQVDVAEALGKPQSFVAKYESGERRLDVLEFIHVAQVLGADPVALVRKLAKAMAK